MTNIQLKNMATYLKQIVEAEGSPVAKWTIPGLMSKVQQLESCYATFNATGSELAAKTCNEVRRDVEQIIVMVLRNIAENV